MIKDITATVKSMSPEVDVGREGTTFCFLVETAEREMIAIVYSFPSKAIALLMKEALVPGLRISFHAESTSDFSVWRGYGRFTVVSEDNELREATWQAPRPYGDGEKFTQAEQREIASGLMLLASKLEHDLNLDPKAIRRIKSRFRTMADAVEKLSKNEWVQLVTGSAVEVAMDCGQGVPFKESLLKAIQSLLGSAFRKFLTVGSGGDKLAQPK